MSLAKIMTTPVVTVEMDDSLRHLKELFDHASFHHLIVVNQNKLAGVISDKDLYQAVSPYIGTEAELARDLATMNKKAHQIMSRNVHSLEKHNSIYDALWIFNNHRVSCIPIVNELYHPIGIVSWRDIIRVLAEKWEKRAVQYQADDNTEE